MRQDPALLDHLEERQHEISGNAENLARTVVLQALQQRYRQCGHRILATGRAWRAPPLKHTRSVIETAIHLEGALSAGRTPTNWEPTWRQTTRGKSAV